MAAREYGRERKHVRAKREGESVRECVCESEENVHVCANAGERESMVACVREHACVCKRMHISPYTLTLINLSLSSTHSPWRVRVRRYTQNVFCSAYCDMLAMHGCNRHYMWPPCEYVRKYETQNICVYIYVYIWPPCEYARG